MAEKKSRCGCLPLPKQEDKKVEDKKVKKEKKTKKSK